MGSILACDLLREWQETLDMKPWTSVRIANLCAIGFALLIPLFLAANPAAGRDDEARPQSPHAAPQARNTIAGIDQRGKSSQELLLRAANLQPAPFRNATDAATVKSRAPSQGVSAIEAGRQAFQRYGCRFCHGEDLKGGVANPNAQGGEVPALIHVSEDYSNDEILNLIRDGRTAPLEKKNDPPPPIYMPQWKKIMSDQYIHDILSYLQSKQEKKTESW
jgi:mono/diheme cytochrome c family protein